MFHDLLIGEKGSFHSITKEKHCRIQLKCSFSLVNSCQWRFHELLKTLAIPLRRLLRLLFPWFVQ